MNQNKDDDKMCPINIVQLIILAFFSNVIGRFSHDVAHFIFEELFVSNFE